MITRTSQNIELSERLGEWIIWPHLDIRALQILPSEVWPTHELSPELQKWNSNVCHLKEQSEVIKKVANNLFSWAQGLLHKAGLKIQSNFLIYKIIASSHKSCFIIECYRESNEFFLTTSLKRKSGEMWV